MPGAPLVQQSEWRTARAIIDRTEGIYGPPEPFLVPVDPLKTANLIAGTARVGLRWTEHPDNLLEFIALEPSPSALLAYANRHGALGIEQPIVFPGEESNPTLVFGESLRGWQFEWYDLHYAQRIWQASADREAPDTDTLAQLIRWQESTDPRRVPVFTCLMATPKLPEYLSESEPGEKAREIVSYDERWQGVQADIERGDLLAAARYYLYREIEDHLSSSDTMRLQCTPQLSSVTDPFTPQPVRPLLAVGVRWNKTRLKPDTILKPTCLLGSLWQAFQRDVENNIAFRKCQYCGAHFKPGVERGQKAKWCSSNCRTKGHYRRRGGRQPRA
jgi:hypothetical protein